MPHTGVTAGCLREGQPAPAGTLTSTSRQPTGLPWAVFTFLLICTVCGGKVTAIIWLYNAVAVCYRNFQRGQMSNAKSFILGGEGGIFL